MNATIENTKKYMPQKAKPSFDGKMASFEIPASEIIAVAHDLLQNKHLSLKLITATDERGENGCFKIWYIFGAPKENIFIVPFIQLKNIEDFPSLAATVHGAWNYERKIKTFFGLTPVGHPDNRPIILHENWPANLFPLRKDFAWQTRPELAKGKYDFQKVAGEGIYEIPVGPIHAGIIEPGHFRFSVAGEEIMLLEPRLGYTHKGSEKLFEHLPLADKVRLSEKISGDSSFSHSLAFCQALEELSDLEVGQRAKCLRVVYAELERLANHFGDIGAIMTDTGFNFGGSHGARLREKIMQINERLTGSRFLRGVNAIGGVAKDIDADQKNKLIKDLKDIAKDFSEVIEVAEDRVSLLNRLKGTGILTPEISKEHGVLGVAAKALGLANDTRFDYPYAGYDELTLGEIATEKDGDVYARFRVRVKEVYQSINIIEQALQKLPKEALAIVEPNKSLKKNAVVVSAVEGWRGEIIYFVATDSQGNISRVAVRDPSFVNWPALGPTGAGNVVPDFPLINKSFNLTYSGNDV